MIIKQFSILGEYMTPSAKAFEITSQDVICGSGPELGANADEFEDDPDFTLF